MILNSNLEHLASVEEHELAINENENVMVCCGRMGPMCVPVYDAMTTLEPEYKHVAFRDMAFDAPFAGVIRNLPETAGFMGLPYTVYYRNGKVVKATTSIQSEAQVRTILDEHFSTETVED